MARRYRGPLSIEQIAEGAITCIENAEALFEEALLLAENGHHARSLSSVLAADQELGKASVLGAMARTDPGEKDQWRDRWNSFYQHETKAAHAFMHLLPDDQRRSLESVLRAGHYALNDEGPSSEQLRRATLYVDFSPTENSWKTPLDVDASIVATRIEATGLAIDRVRMLRDAGLYTAQAFQIQREELSALTKAIDDVDDEEKMTPEEWESLSKKLVAAHKRVLRRWREAGLGEGLPENTEFLGSPLQ